MEIEGAKMERDTYGMRMLILLQFQKLKYLLYAF